MMLTTVTTLHLLALDASHETERFRRESYRTSVAQRDASVRIERRGAPSADRLFSKVQPNGRPRRLAGWMGPVAIDFGLSLGRRGTRGRSVVDLADPVFPTHPLASLSRRLTTIGLAGPVGRSGWLSFDLGTARTRWRDAALARGGIGLTTQVVQIAYAPTPRLAIGLGWSMSAGRQDRAPGDRLVALSILREHHGSGPFAELRLFGPRAESGSTARLDLRLSHARLDYEDAVLFDRSEVADHRALLTLRAAL